MSDSASITGPLLFLSSLLAFSLQQQSRKAKVLEADYWAERKGRQRVELEMKRIADVQLRNAEGFFVQPIAEVGML